MLLKNYDIDYITEIIYNHDEYFLHWYVKQNDMNYARNLYFSNIFINYIKECLNRTKPKYIIFPIILHDPSSLYDNNYITNLNLNHMVVFIYDTEKKIMEYFDPTNNSKYYDVNLLPDVFLKMINNMLTIQHFINVNEYDDNKLGIQTIQENEVNNENKKIGETIGLCGIYVIWFIEQRILFEHENANNIIKKNLKNKTCSLTDMIVNYKFFLNNLCLSKISSIKKNKEYYEYKYCDLDMIIELIYSFEEKNNNEIQEDQKMIW